MPIEFINYIDFIIETSYVFPTLRKCSETVELYQPQFKECCRVVGTVGLATKLGQTWLKPS